MMSYMDVFLLLASMAAGILIGCGLTLLILSLSENATQKRKWKRQEKARMKKESAKKRRTKDAAPSAAADLRQQLDQKRNNSWTEMNCNLDQKDEKSYISAMQTREDRAYQYLKRKGGKAD